MAVLADIFLLTQYPNPTPSHIRAGSQAIKPPSSAAAPLTSPAAPVRFFSCLLPDCAFWFRILDFLL